MADILFSLAHERCPHGRMRNAHIRDGSGCVHERVAQLRDKAQVSVDDRDQTDGKQQIDEDNSDVFEEPL